MATLFRRRVRAQATLLALLGLLAFVVGGVASGVTGYLVATTDTATTLSDLPASELSVEITAEDVGDAAIVSEAIEESLAELLGDVPHELYRSQTSGRRDIDLGELIKSARGGGVAEPARGHAMSFENLADHVELTSGNWPTDDQSGPIQAGIHLRQATDFGLDVGDIVTFAGMPDAPLIKVVAVWEPLDPAAPFWSGDLDELGDEESAGLLMTVTVHDLHRIPRTSPISRWRMAPAVGELTSGDAATLAAELPSLGLRMEADVRLDDVRVVIDNPLVDVLREVDARVQAARSVAVVPLVILAVSSVLALGMIASLLARLRASETALLRARGGSVRQVTLWISVEAMTLVGMPAFLGAAAAWLALRPTSDVGNLLSAHVLIGTAAIAAVVGTFTTAGVGVRSAARVVESTVEQRAAASRRQSITRSGSVVLIIVTALVTMWQLHRYGALTVIDAAGGARIDPLTVAAPAAALLAGGIVAALIVAGIALGIERLTGRHRGLTGVLAIRSVARSPGAYLLPIVIVTLAAGSGSLAAGFAGSWTGLQGATATQRTGADFQVVLPGGDAAAAAEYLAVDGVSAATAVAVAPRAAAAGTAVELVALPTTGPAPVGAAVIPASSEGLELEFVVASDLVETELAETGRIRAAIWLVDASGVPVHLEVADIEVVEGIGRGVHRVSADVPVGTEPWSLVGVDLQILGPQGEGRESWVADLDVALLAAWASPSGSEIALDRQSWALTGLGVLPRDEHGFVEATAEAGPGVAVNSFGRTWEGTVGVRLTPDEMNAAQRLRVTATASALSSFGLSVGDIADLSAFGTRTPIKVVATADAMSGTTRDDVMVADLRDLTTLLLAAGQSPPTPTQIRIDAEATAIADGSVAMAVAELAGPEATVLDRQQIENELRDDALAHLSMAAFWIVGVTVALLGVGALAAGAAALAIRRRAEAQVLRSFGFSLHQQGRARSLEFGAVAMLGLVLGTAIGWLVTVLTVRFLVRAATPSIVTTVEPAVRLSIGPWLLFVMTIGLFALAVALGYGRRVRRQGATARALGQWS